MTYDTTRPHQVLVGKGRAGIVLQDGHAYERGSKKQIGPAHVMMKDDQAKRLGYMACSKCCGTFTNAGDLESHVYARHRDVLLAAVQKHAPKDIKGVWSPSEDMIQEAATKLVSEMNPDLKKDALEAEPEEPAPAIAKGKPSKKDFREGR